jgi:threonine dehydratase
MLLPSKKNIEQAYLTVKRFAHRTPVLTSQSINRILGCEIFFKCENFQKVGAFKFRGATNAVFNLSDDEAQRGVCTHSSGNHAAAIALAASLRGIPSYIVMPINAPTIKRKAVEGYGAIITTCEPTQAHRESKLDEVQRRTGATFIHPYDNFNVICGQGTASMEMLEDVSDLEIIITPVGGGGLLSGTLIYTKETNPRISVYAGEPQNADDAHRSLRDGTLYPSINPNTIADGLRTSLSPLTFSIIQKYADGILTVPEVLIVEAMQLIWERMKIIIEPSSAVPIAAIIQKPSKFKGKKVGVIISGGNVELEKLPFGF